MAEEPSWRIGGAEMRQDIKEDTSSLLFPMEEFDSYTRTVGAM